MILLLLVDVVDVVIYYFDVLLRANCHLKQEVELEEGYEVLDDQVDHGAVNCHVVS